MRCLVTGGAGFIGSHIAEELLAQGHEVLVLDNLSVGSRKNVPDGALLVVGDIRDADLLACALSGVEAVFHNAAFVSIRGSFERLEYDLDVNCRGTLNLLRACTRAGVRRFVLASSMAVYGAPEAFPVREIDPVLPNSPYGLSKLRGEMYCRIFHEQQGLESVVLRYFNTFGPRQTPSPYVGVLTTFIHQALQGKPMTIHGDGSQRRDFVSVRDVAMANLRALSAPPGTIINVASGTETTVESLADGVISALGGGEKVFLPAPPGEIPRMLADISRARAVLDFGPRSSILESIPELVAAWKTRLS